MLDFVDAVRALVEAESPSSEPATVEQAQRVLVDLGRRLLDAEPEWYRSNGGPSSVAWHLGDADDPRRVLLLGHIDTVWPLNTVQRRPFTEVDDRLTGPGVFDMKAGLVLGLQTLAELDEEVPVTFLVTGDEEVGSGASRGTIESVALDCQACLVLEGAAAGGAVKSARRGWSFYTVEFEGRAAHAGLEPEKGVNVLPALADVVFGLRALNRPRAGITATPTQVHAGTTVNTVPGHGELTIDVRCDTGEQQTEVDKAIHGLADDAASGVQISVRGGVNRPPMPKQSAEALLQRLALVQRGRGVEPPDDVAVGGISDANLTAALGVPTLDGLGAVGGGAHADHEWVDLTSTRDRVPMLALLIDNLVSSPLKTTTRHDGRAS